MEKKYNITINECSRDLTAVERIKLKDLTDATNINSVVENEGTLIIDVAFYATVSIHNDYSDDKDYEHFVIVDTDGAKYYTGSQSFIESFMNIAAELATEGITEYQIKCYGVESKNYKGRSFLTCSLI